MWFSLADFSQILLHLSLIKFLRRLVSRPVQLISNKSNLLINNKILD